VPAQRRGQLEEDAAQVRAERREEDGDRPVAELLRHLRRVRRTHRVRGQYRALLAGGQV
jgi:hypothetical protein